MIYLSLAWVVMLFTLTGIPGVIARAVQHINQELGEFLLALLSCSLCLGFYTGIVYGIVAYYGNLGPILLSGALVSAYSFGLKSIVRAIQLAIDLLEIQVERRGN